jgi:hypothetical protein
LEEAAGGGGSDGGEPPKMGKTTVRGQLATTGLMKRRGEGGGGGRPEGPTRATDAFWPVDETRALGGGGGDVNRALALLSGGNMRESRERG